MCVPIGLVLYYGNHWEAFCLLSLRIAALMLYVVGDSLVNNRQVIRLRG